MFSVKYRLGGGGRRPSVSIRSSGIINNVCQAVRREPGVAKRALPFSESLASVLYYLRGIAQVCCHTLFLWKEGSHYLVPLAWNFLCV